MKLNNKFSFNIHYSFYILFALCIFTGNVLEFIIFILSILLHEAFHGLAGLVFKIKIRKIELYCIGGYLDMDLNNVSPLKKLIVSISGILFNITIVMIISLNVINTKYNELIFQYNIILIIFNLIPVYPLDGFNILESILELIYKEKYKLSINYSSYISVIFLVILLGLTIYFKSLCLLIVVFYLSIKNILYIKNYNLVYLKKIAGSL